MADKDASANTGLPSVASMGGGSLTLTDVSRMASKPSEPAITGVSEDTAIPFDDDAAPVAPAQDAAPAPAPTTETKPATTTEDKPTVTEDPFQLPDEVPAQDTPPAAEKVEDPAAPAPVETPSARKYEDYPEELRPVLKSLNNANFAKYAPILKSLHAESQRAKQLETELAEARKGPQYFYEHPEGYRLSPEYRQVESQLGMCDFEIEHWRQQLIAVKSGQPWSELKGYKPDAQGNPSEPVFETHAPPQDGRPDSTAEVRVMQLLQQTTQARQQIMNRAQTIVGGYAQSGERARSELAEVDKRLFAKLGPVDKLPPEEKKYYDMAVGAVPRYFKGHPLTDALGKVHVAYNRLLQRALKANDEIIRLKAEIAGRKQAVPTRIPAGGGNGKVAKEDEVINYQEL